MTSRTSTPLSAERPKRPTWSVNFLTREQHEDVLQVGGAALALIAVGVHHADRGPGAARPVAGRLGFALDLEQARRRTVDLDRLKTRVLGDQRARLARSD